MAGVLMNTQTTINRIYEYVEMIQGKQDDYWRVHKYTHSPSNEVDVNLGRKYAKVILKGREWGPQKTPMTLNRHKSVHSFVDMHTGDILKAAGWNAPAPNGVRGNIFSYDCGSSVVGHSGCNYKYNYA
jgi:hypothetical protein